MGHPAVSTGRTAQCFIARAILENVRQDTLENTLRRVLREELRFSPVQPEAGQEDPIPQEMLHFLDTLS